MTSCHEVMTRDVSRRGSRRHGVGPGAAAGQLHHGQSGPPAWPRLSPRPGQVHHDRPPERTGGDATLREQQPGADRRRFQHTRPRRPRVPPRPRAAHDHRLPGILEVVCAKDQTPGARSWAAKKTARRVPRLPVPEGSLQDDRRPKQADTGLGLNDRGQVLGGTVDPGSGRISGFLLEDGVYTTIDFAGNLSTNALDINNRGDITGVYADAGEPAMDICATGSAFSRDTAWPSDELTATVRAHSAELVSASTAERALVAADPSFAVGLQRRPTSLTLHSHLEHESMLPHPACQHQCDSPLGRSGRRAGVFGRPRHRVAYLRRRAGA